mgnify:CR=1 FL=1
MSVERVTFVYLQQCRNTFSGEIRVFEFCRCSLLHEVLAILRPRKCESLGRREKSTTAEHQQPQSLCFESINGKFFVASEKWIARSDALYVPNMPGTDALEALVVQQEAKRFETFHESVLQLHDLLEELDNVTLKRKMRQKLTQIEGRNKLLVMVCSV